MPSNTPIASLQLSAAQLNRLFPFHILLGRDLIIRGAGGSIVKLMGRLQDEPFLQHFNWRRPAYHGELFSFLQGIPDQLVIFQGTHHQRLLLRGQWEFIPAWDALLFFGSPWYASVEEIANDHLTLNDFPPHDAVIDMLHVLKAQEITNTDLKELLQTVHQQQSLLSKAEQKYRGIIANMHLGLLEVDRNDVIQYVNQSFCEMSGYSSDELLGRSAMQIFLDHEKQDLIEEKNKRREEGQSDAYELEVKNKQGEKKWWLISGAPLYNDDGDVIGSIGIHLDITSQKAMERDLRKAKEQAEASTRTKEIFLANMSHEIRTPLNAIQGMADQLSHTVLESQQQFFLTTIQTAAENLLVIINDILDLSKIDAGKLTLEHIGFQLPTALSRSVQVLRHKAEDKGLSLTLDIHQEKMAAVHLGDPYRLNQVMLNLLSNAIKFTHRGSIHISCRVQEDHPSLQLISIQVKDTGIGMDAEFLTHLFDSFSQEDSSVTRKYGGTGLGMNICQQLMHLMGGEIAAESEKGKGTVVTCLIPLQKGQITDLPVQPSTQRSAEILKGKEILVVDDNDINRLLAATILKNYEVKVTEAVNGEEALACIRQRPFDLVLMDVQMPVMDGLEASRIIRKEISQQLPLIALTANAYKSDAEKCLEAGMNDFISKPFREQQLIQCIALCLDTQRELYIH